MAWMTWPRFTVTIVSFNNPSHLSGGVCPKLQLPGQVFGKMTFFARELTMSSNSNVLAAAPDRSNASEPSKLVSIHACISSALSLVVIDTVVGHGRDDL
jgi:hypothetical protein